MKMKLSELWPFQQHRVGLSIDEAGFSLALVRCGRPSEVIARYAEAWSNGFSGEQLKLCLKKVLQEQGWSRAVLNVATAQAEFKTLSLPQIPDKELPQAVFWEVFTQWGIQPEEHVLIWSKIPETQEIQVGVLTKPVLQEYVKLAGDLGLKLAAVTAGMPAEAAVLPESGYQGNFLQSGQPEGGNIFQKSLFDVLRCFCYVLGILLGAMCLTWAGLRYCLWQEEEKLAALQVQKNQYEEATAIQGQISKLQHYLTATAQKYVFHPGQVEKILDAMPPFDNEIISLQQQANNRGKILEINGKMGSLQDLQLFIKNLQTTGVFQNVILRSSQRQGESLNYVIQGVYGVQHGDK